MCIISTHSVTNMSIVSKLTGRPSIHSDFTKLYFTSNFINGENIWLKEGERYICITFSYNNITGELYYASCICRKESCMSLIDDSYSDIITSIEIKNHEHTTKRRYELRPVIINIPENLELNIIINEIRYEMCRGYGCKGFRYNYPSPNSPNDYLSSIPKSFNVDPYIHNLTDVHSKHFSESHKDAHRDTLICYKGDERSGHLIYGASIHSNSVNSQFHKTFLENETEINEHYKTATARLNKCPVHIQIPVELRWQLNINDAYPYPTEGLTNYIYNNIYKRLDGKLQIKGSRYFEIL